MASSVLASQLKKLALARGGDAPLRVKGKPSLLYDPREAADINLQTIFEVAQTGKNKWCIASLDDDEQTPLAFGIVIQRLTVDD